jgi:O-antigen/teichoic acid export membrane protein
MKPVQKQSVKKNYVYNLVYQMLAVVIPLMIQPYIARVLGAGEVGAFSYTTAITGYFALVGNLGIATYGQLRVAAFRNDRRKVSQVFWELAVLRFLMMSASACLFWLFIRLLARPEYKTLYMVLTIQILASAIDIAWLLQGFEEFKKIVLRNTLIKLLSVILIFTFVKKESDIYIYALIMNGSTLVGNASIW